jgi:hypothetical protein
MRAILVQLEMLASTKSEQFLATIGVMKRGAAADACGRRRVYFFT